MLQNNYTNAFSFPGYHINETSMPPGSRQKKSNEMGNIENAKKCRRKKQEIKKKTKRKERKES
jgi:hypothetical protein